MYYNLKILKICLIIKYKKRLAMSNEHKILFCTIEKVTKICIHFRVGKKMLY